MKRINVVFCFVVILSFDEVKTRFWGRTQTIRDISTLFAHFYMKNKNQECFSTLSTTTKPVTTSEKQNADAKSSPFALRRWGGGLGRK